MGKWNRRSKGTVFNTKQRKRIKKTLFQMFEDNQVAVVDMVNGELRPYQIRVYVMLKAGFE